MASTTAAGSAASAVYTRLTMTVKDAALEAAKKARPQWHLIDAKDQVCVGLRGGCVECPALPSLLPSLLPAVLALRYCNEPLLLVNIEPGPWPALSLYL